MADPIVNFFKSTLVGTYSDTDTSFTIATGDGAKLPDPAVDGAFNLVVYEGSAGIAASAFEIVRVTAKSGDVLTVTREQEGTSALTIGATIHSIILSATKKTFDDINTAIENVDLTTLSAVESLTFDTTGDEVLVLPKGTTAQRPSSPTQGMIRYNTSDAIGLELYTGVSWRQIGLTGLFQAETSVANANAEGLDGVASAIISFDVEYLVIAGGGAGGSFSAGGGGAGGYRSSVTGESSGGGASAESKLNITTGSPVTVTVGAGGAGVANSSGTSGSNSVFSTITSIGGGGGGRSSNNGLAGGSGGGSGKGAFGGSGTANQGYDGGDERVFDVSAGGGGAGQLGQDGVVNNSGDGGNGVSSSITGSSIGRAGGGGGGGKASEEGSATDGGGAGSYSTGNSGTVNTGGGGGGVWVSASAGGAGGSGLVVLRYPSSVSITIGAGLTGSETTVGANKVATITAGTGNVSWS